MLDLAEGWQPPFAFLYVLIVSRDDRWPAARYQSQWYDELSAIKSFLRAHQQFLEGDSRHELWLFLTPTKTSLCGRSTTFCTFTATIGGLASFCAAAGSRTA
ncbi:MAG: hypothetical protein AAFV19_17115 [Pseudomonadota bacterium]